MDNDELEEYFEGLATRCKPIGHTPAAPRFARFNMEEVFTGLRANLDLSAGPCLLLETPTGTLEDNGGDGYFDNGNVAFMVIQQVEQLNYVMERAVLKMAKVLGRQVMLKVREERDRIQIDLSTVEYEKVGPLFNNAYGYRYSFVIPEPLSTRLDAGLWDG